VYPIVARFNSHIVGMAVISVGRDLPESSDVPGANKNSAYLMTLGVAAECRGLGIGKKLLLHAEKLSQIKNMPVLYLHVIEYNLLALQMYKNCGFVCGINKPNFYRIGEIDYSAITLYKRFSWWSKLVNKLVS
jgi:ribosomal protein S18 acetylase RimI-like enzyme